MRECVFMCVHVSSFVVSLHHRIVRRAGSCVCSARVGVCVCVSVRVSVPQAWETGWCGCRRMFVSVWVYACACVYVCECVHVCLCVWLCVCTYASTVNMLKVIWGTQKGKEKWGRNPKACVGGGGHLSHFQQAAGAMQPLPVPRPVRVESFSLFVRILGSVWHLSVSVQATQRCAYTLICACACMCVYVHTSTHTNTSHA